MGKFGPAIEAASKKPNYQLPNGVHYSYGTAGFRTKASILEPVLFRVGLLAALRSKSLKGKTVGVMITASHNPVEDNGVKLVDPMGEMLMADWEEYATEMANTGSSADLIHVMKKVAQKYSVDPDTPANVVFARDTRPSGDALVAALVDGLNAVQTHVLDLGIQTTPQLHYVVRCLNTQGTPNAYGEPTEEGYFSKLGKAYKALVKGKPKLTPLYVDGACGVGAPKMQTLAQLIGDELDCVVMYTDIANHAKLNNKCGADYVKVHQCKPEGHQVPLGSRCCSLDGDADRIIFYFENDKGFGLLDGDRIASLAASYIIELVREAKLTLKDGKSVQVGVVQTAYANGNATAYLRDVMNIPVAIGKTGVKNLHHKAELYDVGVYFEANGHGTVLFSNELISEVTAHRNKSPAHEKLYQLIQLINQAVGDAISDLLMVEAILRDKQWTMEKWLHMYEDLPSKLLKLKVKNRNLFVPNEDESRLLQPETLQKSIDKIVAEYAHGRSFVRPSGTEDVVRIYAEASTPEKTEELANRIGGLVFDTAGGVGTRPKEFI